MITNNHGAERIVNALHAADSLVSTLKEAQAGLENEREKSLLMESLSDAQIIRDMLKRLTKAVGTE